MNKRDRSVIDREKPLKLNEKNGVKPLNSRNKSKTNGTVVRKPSNGVEKPIFSEIPQMDKLNVTSLVKKFTVDNTKQHI